MRSTQQQCPRQRPTGNAPGSAIGARSGVVHRSNAMHLGALKSQTAVPASILLGPAVVVLATLVPRHARLAIQVVAAATGRARRTACRARELPCYTKVSV